MDAMERQYWRSCIEMVGHGRLGCLRCRRRATLGKGKYTVAFEHNTMSWFDEDDLTLVESGDRGRG